MLLFATNDMAAYWSLVSLVLGLIIGSFINVIIYRYGSKRSALVGRSFCPKCKHELRWFELIPVISFFILGGRCARCKAPVSWRYLIMELVTGVGTSLIVISAGLSFETAALLIAFWTSLVIIGIDIDHLIIPDSSVVVLGALGLIYQILNPDSGGIELVFGGGLAAVLILGSIVAASRGKGMGLGDVKLGGVLGIWLGWPIVVAGLFAAVIIGAIFGLCLIVVRKKRMSDPIPFGPFLLVGAALAMIWGEWFIRFYII